MVLISLELLKNFFSFWQARMADDAAKTAAIKKKVDEFANFGRRVWPLYGAAGGKETLAQLSHEQQQKLHAPLSSIYNELVQLGGHEGKTKVDLLVEKVPWKNFSKDTRPFYNEQSRRNLLQEFQIEKEQANAHNEDDANNNSGRGRERDRRRRNHNSHHEDDTDRSRSRSKHHRPSNRNKSDNEEDDDVVIVGDYDEARKNRKRKNKRKKRQSKKQEEDDNDADAPSVCMSPLS